MQFPVRTGLREINVQFPVRTGLWEINVQSPVHTGLWENILMSIASCLHSSVLDSGPNKGSDGVLHL